MSTKQHERTVARCSALQVLYTAEIKGENPSDVLDDGLCLVEDYPLSDYALDLIKGTEEHLDFIDDQLRFTSENWTLDRMPVVDRVILRLAVYEMVYVGNVPIPVAINEAVELARKFGGEEDSPRFVNGVLGRIASRLEAERRDAEAGLRDAEADGEDGGDAVDAVDERVVHAQAGKEAVS